MRLIQKWLNASVLKHGEEGTRRVIVMCYADDALFGLQFKERPNGSGWELKERMQQFRLELHP